MMFKPICSYALFLWCLVRGPKASYAQLVEPEWWPLLEANHVGPRLDRCNKRDGFRKPLGPPPNGQRCARRPKTCYFDNQSCGTTLYPATRCICTNRNWQCEPALCPGPESIPTFMPTDAPDTTTQQPLTLPSDVPTSSPSDSPIPSDLPSPSPSDSPTPLPTLLDITVPSEQPSVLTSSAPSDSPSPRPTPDVISVEIAKFAGNDAQEADDAYQRLLRFGDASIGQFIGLAVDNSPFAGTGEAFVDQRSSIARMEPASVGLLALYAIESLLFNTSTPHLAPILATETTGLNESALLSEVAPLYQDWWDQNQGLPLSSLQALPNPLNGSSFFWLTGFKNAPVAALADDGTGTEVPGTATEAAKEGGAAICLNNIPPADKDDEGAKARASYTWVLKPKVEKPIRGPTPYNCIAWAFCKEDRWLQPIPLAGKMVWKKILGDHGYDTKAVTCDGKCPDNCGPKIKVIFHGNKCDDSTFKHAMKMQDDGKWSSKNGELPRYKDITNCAAFLEKHDYVPKVIAGKKTPKLQIKCFCKKKPIKGSVQEDTNKDKTGDTALSGVVIILTAENNTVIATTQTDSNGEYEFVDLEAGNYTVIQKNLEGYFDVSDADGDDPNAISVTLSSNESTGNDFVDEQESNPPSGAPSFLRASIIPSELSSTLPSDVPTSSPSDSPTPIPSDLPSPSPSDYPTSIPSDLPSPLPSDSPTPETTSDAISDQPSTVPSLGPLGSISGNVKEDTNDDGSGDANLSHVSITLWDSSGVVLGTTLTDSEGNYLFLDLPSGTFTVVETNLASYVDVSDSDGANDNVITVVVDGFNSTGNDFVDEMPLPSSDFISGDEAGSG